MITFRFSNYRLTINLYMWFGAFCVYKYTQSCWLTACYMCTMACFGYFISEKKA